MSYTYSNVDENNTLVPQQLVLDTLALLKAQEPRVMTLQQAITSEHMSAVDAAPVVHARWRELSDGVGGCASCFGLCPREGDYDGDVIFDFGCEYCPWCGAKMVEGTTN